MPQEGASCGRALRKKLIDAARRLRKSALSLQERAGRRDPIALGIENRYPITVVALVVKCKLVSVIAMCAGRHRDAHEKPQGRCRQEFPPSSVLRAEHQVGLGEGTTFSSHSEANSYVSYLLLHVFGDPRRSYSAATRSR